MDGVFDSVLPSFVAVHEIGFRSNLGHAAEHNLAEIGESLGVGLGDAVLGEGGEDFAEDVGDVRGGEVVAGK